MRTASKQGMHDLGWVAGQNVEYRIAYANGNVGRLDAKVLGLAIPQSLRLRADEVIQ